MTSIERRPRLFAAIALIFPVFSQAQVPVDDTGNVIGAPQTGAEIMSIGEDGIPRLSSLELQELVGPVALYPDDLLAIVLPASAYPLQIAAAARFLDARTADPALEPDPEWDDSVVALLNYPEVVELLDKDLDWTYRLGEAVVAQQTDVIAAVESFRDRAYAAGNLKSDGYQTVARENDTIHITPVAEDVIYVPYYEPARVVTYQSRPAYYYYPRPCPVYYYPYASNHYFDRGYFWGVTTAFSIGWVSDSLSVWHHSYRGHPYFGHRYRSNNWWYRRPTINVYNTTYVDNTVVTVNRYNQDRYNRGDRWRARENRREFVRREGYSRDRRQTNRLSSTGTVRTRTPEPVTTVRTRQAEPIRFRDRPANVTPADRTRTNRQTTRLRDREPEIQTRDGVTRSRRHNTEPRITTPPRQRDTQRTPPRETRIRPQRETRRVPQHAPPRETRSAPPREARRAPQRQERPAPNRETRGSAARAPEPQQQRSSERRSSERKSDERGRRTRDR